MEQMDVWELLFWLVVAHAIGDFVLQPEAMALGKSRTDVRHQNEGFPPWYIWLSAHALTHGGAVFLITQSMLLGLVEVLVHTAIDWLKCEDKISFNADQGLHLLSKLVYVGFLI